MADIESTIILKADGKGAVESIKDLRNNVNKYKNDLVRLDEGSEKYNDTLKKLAESQNALNNIQRDARVVTMNLTDVYSQLTRVAAGVAGGFGALSSATALLGNDNEHLAETLVKVQAGLALTQQLTTLSAGIKAANLAFKALNVTLAANPLLAVGAVLATVAGLLIGVANNVSHLRSGIDDLNKSYDNQKKQLEQTNNVREREIDILRASGATTQEIIDLRRTQIEEDINSARLEVQNRQAEINALASKFKVWFSGESKRLKALKEIQKEETERIDALVASLDNLNHQYTVETVKEDKKREDERVRIQQQANKQREAETKRFNDAELKSEQSHANILENIEIEKQKRITDAYSGETRLNFIRSEIEANEQLQEILLTNATDESLTWQQREQAAKDYQQALRDSYTLNQESAKLEEEIREARIASDEKREQTTAELIDLAQRLRLAENPENLTIEERIERIRAEGQAELERAKDSTLSYEERIQAISNYNKAMEESAKLDKKLKDDEDKLRQVTLSSTAKFLTESSKLLGENTVAGKALAVAGATINTYVAGTLALSTYPPPASYAALAATIATGLATVKNILSTDIPGASDSTSAATASLPSMPELSSPIVETHNNMSSYDEELLNTRPVLVVEDVNEVQHSVSVAVSEATY